MRFPATTIDLSTLPQPQIIQNFLHDDIVAALKVDAIARAAMAGITLDTLDLETETISIIFESCAYREMLMRAQVNDDALALLLAFATGADLEQIGVRFGVTRMVTYATDGVTIIATETDTRLRKRIQLAPDAYSNAGTLRGYQYHALSATLEIVDCNAFSPTPGRVDVVVMSATGAPTDNALNAVYKRLTSTEVKPLTDDVRVYKVKVIPYVLGGILRIPRGPDPAIIRAQAEASARSYAASVFKVGSKVYATGCIGSMQVPMSSKSHQARRSKISTPATMRSE
jgi:phage-related baseplate assembly protein